VEHERQAVEVLLEERLALASVLELLPERILLGVQRDAAADPSQRIGAELLRERACFAREHPAHLGMLPERRGRVEERACVRVPGGGASVASRVRSWSSR
jgi:hypothetical protein